jgi:myosin heavy subunit
MKSRTLILKKLLVTAGTSALILANTACGSEAVETTAPVETETEEQASETETDVETTEAEETAEAEEQEQAEEALSQEEQYAQEILTFKDKLEENDILPEDEELVYAYTGARNDRGLEPEQAITEAINHVLELRDYEAKEAERLAKEEQEKKDAAAKAEKEKQELEELQKSQEEQAQQQAEQTTDQSQTDNANTGSNEAVPVNKDVAVDNNSNSSDDYVAPPITEETLEIYRMSKEWLGEDNYCGPGEYGGDL